MCWNSRLGVDFKNRISIASQEKENKILCLMKKWKPLHLTLDNSKPEEGLGDYKEKIKNVQGEFELSNMNFEQKEAVRVV